MNIRQRFLPLSSLALLVTGVLVCFTTTASPVYADGKCQADEVQISVDLGSGVKNEGSAASPIYCIAKNTDSTDLTKNPIYVWVVAIIKFMIPGVGIAVVGGIIWGAIVYTSAGDNASKTKQAIIIITNSVISLIFFLLLFAIINFVVPGGVLK